MKKLVSFVKENRTGFKVISMILVLALMIQTVSIAVTAITESGVLNDEMVSVDEAFPFDNSLETMPSIVGEVESKRDQHTKVYELADGSFYEVISNDPIHKNVDGQWEEPANNMDMPESVDEVTSYCEELIDSIAEEQNDGGVSTFSLVVDEEILHPLCDKYFVNSSGPDGTGKVLSGNKITMNNRLFIRIPDSLLLFSNTNEITLNQNLSIQCSDITLDEDTEKAFLYAYAITDYWSVSSDKLLIDDTEQNVKLDDIVNSKSIIDDAILEKDSTSLDFDITEICIDWNKKLLDNNGICIKTEDTTTKTAVGYCYLSRRYLVVDAYDTDFTYHSVDMGKAGQVLVNDFTNTITIQRNEMYYPTGKMPINLYRYFDFSKSYSDPNPAGIGSHWNYESPIIAEKSDRIAWRAFDGRTIRFEPSETDSTKWFPKNSKEYELNLNGADITTAEYDGITINSSDGLTYTFGAVGKIKKIEDGKGNYIFVKYNGIDEPTESSPQDYITTIENNSGYRYYFEYSNDYNLDGLQDSGKFALNRIYYQKNTGPNQYSTVNIDGVDAVMTYVYTLLPDGNLALSKVTYPHDSQTPERDWLTVEYLYENGRLVGVVDIDKRKLEINYTGEVPDYIDSDATRTVDNYPSAFTLTEKVLNKEYSSDVEGTNEYLEKSSLNINRLPTYRREFVDHLGNIETIHYNKELKLLYYTNSNEESYYVEYATSDEQQYVSQILSPEKIKNELYNGDFEFENNKLLNWNANSKSAMKVANPDEDNPENDFLELKGTIEAKRFASNFVEIDGGRDDVIVVGGLAIANSAVPTDAHFFGIEIYEARFDEDEEMITTTSNLLYRLAFDPTMDNAKQYRMGAFKLTVPIEYIDFRFVYSYQSNNAYFDDALVYKTKEGNVTFFDPPTSDNNISNDSPSSSNENNNYDPNDTLNDGVNWIGTLYDYSDETNYLTGITDSNDVTTKFSYNEDTGFLTEKRVDMGDDSVDIIDEYSYDALGALTEVSRVVGYTENTNDKIYNTTRYEYEYGKISSVVHNNMTYKFNYNSYGDLENITVNPNSTNETSVISYDYTDDADRNVNKITYSNNYVLEYETEYDEDSLFVNIYERSTPSSDRVPLYKYEYDLASCNLCKITDYVSRRVMKYSDNLFEVCKLAENGIDDGEPLYSKSITKDLDSNEVVAEDISIFSADHSKTINTPLYDDETKTTTYSSSITTDIGCSVEIDSYAACDYFGRIKNSSVVVSEKDAQNNEVSTIKHSVENNSTYLDNAEGTLTTNLLETYSSTIHKGSGETDEVLSEFISEYRYDDAGRITHIFYTENNVGNTNSDGPTNDEGTNDEGTNDEGTNDGDDNNNDVDNENDVDNNKKNSLKYYYEYDVAGQLVKEADFLKQSYTEYIYDSYGNITQKTIYSGNILPNDDLTTVNTAGATSETIRFKYLESHSDVLNGISFSSHPYQDIDIDTYGNPDKYCRINGDNLETFLLEWKGRQLHVVKSADDDSAYVYKYDDEGRRTQKIAYYYYESETSENNIVDMIMDYIWDDNKIMGYRITIPNDTTIIIDTAIIYDELDDPIGLEFHTNGTIDGEDNSDLSNEDIFWFIKDGQGNIVALFSEKSDYVIGCTKTADGKIKITNSSNFATELNQRIEDADDFKSGLLIAVSAILAIRVSTMLSTDASQATYISAIMDEETGLYYCQNRYYSPEYGRYINVGNVEEIASDIYNPFDANPFVYYNNDPVNCKGTASSKKPATKVVGIQAELSKSLTSFTDSKGVELIYDSVKDELYAYYYQDANSYSNYNGRPRAIEMITDIFKNISFTSNISLKNLALVLKMNNYVSLSYFNAETNKRFIWPTSYLGVANVKTDGDNRYTVYGSGYQSKGICYYPVSNLGFGTKDMSVRYQKIDWQSEDLKEYLLTNKDNIIEVVK